MKFAHMSDIHIGSWRDVKLRELSTRAFCKALDLCIEKQVDFILISGDLFNTSLPTIDRLKIVVEKLKQVKNNLIAVYVIAGSHDFSPSGKTMLDVIESAELFTNVVKGEVKDNKLYLQFTIDPKTGAKITGMLGKKGMLDKKYYEALSREHLEQQSGFKIFVYHTAITEFKPTDLELMDSTPLSYFPKGFDYYAGGHVHYIFNTTQKGYGVFAYPGALFPNNFRELEKYKCGGFYLYEDGALSYHPVQLFDVVSFTLDCNNKTIEAVHAALLTMIKNSDVHHKIVTLKLEGTLAHGKPSDIDFKMIMQLLYENGSYFVMKNINRLKSKEFEEIITNFEKSSDIEQSIIDENSGNLKSILFKEGEEKEIVKSLLHCCSIEKQEGERNVDFEERLKKDTESLLSNIFSIFIS